MSVVGMSRFWREVVSFEEGEYWVTTLLSDDGWVLSYRVVELEGNLVVAELRACPEPRTAEQGEHFLRSLEPPDGARPAVPRGGLTMRDLRRGVRLSDALDGARGHFHHLYAEIAADYGGYGRSPPLGRGSCVVSTPVP
jgi:hypothetical protein